MIPVKNIYHMMAYAFQTLREGGYRSMATEEFENSSDLCAAILCRGVSLQIKRGLIRGYETRREALSLLKGKPDLGTSLKQNALVKSQIVCEFDEFTTGCAFNRVLKAAMKILLRADIPLRRKKDLRSLLAYFSDVKDVEPRSIDWHMRYDRNNQSYRLLMFVCWLVVNSSLQTQDSGPSRMVDLFDEQAMHRLYEKFILEYFRREHPSISARAEQVPWALDDGERSLLPIMQTDTTLERGRKALIIDAKFYEHNTQNRFCVATVHSGNLYQMFTYVKNKEEQLKQRFGSGYSVAGMILYARTDDDVQPEADYRMSGNRISVRTLDLGQEFHSVAATLDAIADEFFGRSLFASNLEGSETE